VRTGACCFCSAQSQSVVRAFPLPATIDYPHPHTLDLPTPDAEAIMDAFLPFEVNSEALNGMDW
jgi:hypothetical protein